MLPLWKQHWDLACRSTARCPLNPSHEHQSVEHAVRTRVHRQIGCCTFHSCSSSLSLAATMTRDSVHEQSKCIAFNLSKRKPTASPLQALQCALSWGFCRLLDTQEVGASERQSLWPLALNPTRQDCPSGASNSLEQRFPMCSRVRTAHS